MGIYVSESMGIRLIKLTGSVHGTHGYMVLLLAISLTTIDALSVFRRIIAFVKSGESFAIKTFWRSILLGRPLDRQDLGPEYTELVVGEPEEFEDATVNLSPIRGSTDIDPMQQDFEHGDTAQWANNVHHHRHEHRRQQSMVSERTVFGTPSVRSVDKIQEVKGALSPKVGLFTRIGDAAFATAERALVFSGFSQLLTGIVVYTGSSSLAMLMTVLNSMSRWLSGKLYQRLFGSPDQYGYFSLGLVADLTVIFIRGRHILVVWSSFLCTIPRIFCRTWLGMEQSTNQWNSQCRIHRIFCYFLLRCNEHVDGTVWRQPR